MQNGEVYKGQFKNGVWKRKGILDKKFKYVYQGNFVKRQVQGSRTRRFSNGNVYQRGVSARPVAWTRGGLKCEGSSLNTGERISGVLL